jgi:hypothetical protein
VVGGGKFLAHFGRVLLASLFLFSGMHKYHALARANSTSDFHVLEHSIAPRFAETRAALSASLAAHFEKLLRKRNHGTLTRYRRRDNCHVWDDR